MYADSSKQNITTRLNELIPEIQSQKADSIVSWFIKSGVDPDEIGDAIFNTARYFLSEDQMEFALVLLQILLEASQDSLPQKQTITALIGSILLQSGQYKEARQYYRKLPLNQESFKRLMLTFTLAGDLHGLVQLQSQVINSNHREELLPVIQEEIRKFISIQTENEEVRLAHLARYRKNIRHLEKIDPSVIPEIERFDPNLDHFSSYVFRSDNNIFFVFDNRWYVISDQEIMNQSKTEKWQHLKGINFMVHCICPNQLWEFVTAMQTDAPEFYKFLAYLVMDIKLFKYCLTIIDLEPFADCDHKFRIIDASRFEDAFSNVMIHEKVPFPSKFILFGTEGRRFYDEHCNPLMDHLDRKITEITLSLRNEVFALYPDTFPLGLPEKIKQQPLRVMLWTSVYTTFLQYCTRDLALGFEALGHTVRVSKEKENDPVCNRKDHLYRQIIDFKPDLIIVIDHLKYQFDLPKGLPFVTWIQDLLNNIFGITDPDLLDDNQYLYCSSTFWRNILLEGPAYKHKTIHALPHLLNPEMYYWMDIPKKYDVTYVAHLPAPDVLLKAYSKLPGEAESNEIAVHRCLLDYLEPLSFDELAAYYSGPDALRLELIRKFNEATGILIQKEKINYLRDKVVLLVIRTRLLKKLLDNGIDLHIWGKGWDKHPFFSHVAMGPIKNGPELNRVINQSRINLNINPVMSYHNKVPEVAGAKAFFLTRDVGTYDLFPIDLVFKRDEEVVLFDDENDLLEKVNYYLTHPAEREKIASRAHEKMCKDLTFKAGAERILSDIYEAIKK